MSTGEKKKIKKKPVLGKDFRLFDFRIDTQTEEDDGNGPSMFDNSKLVITMFGLNEKGHTCSIEVNDFKPFFYIKVNTELCDDDFDKLENSIRSALENSGAKKSKYYTKSFNCERVKYNKLYGFASGELSHFVKITFKSSRCYNKVKNFWIYNNINRPSKQKNEQYHFTKYELYESNIPPLLRFFHIQNIYPSGWVRVKAPSKEGINTTCKYKYQCSLSKIIPLNDKEDNVPFKICSFDIEASSSHGDFPVPIKSYKKLAMNIVDNFKKQSLNSNDMKYKFLKKNIEAGFQLKKCDNVDVVYPKVKNSKQKMTDIINTLINMLKEKPANDFIQAESNDIVRKKVNTSYDAAEEDDLNTDIVNENIPEKKTTQKKKLTTNKKYDGMYLVDIIDAESKVPRDEKITILDEILTCRLPELEGDKVTFIGSTFMKHGDSEPYYNNCLVVNDCDPVDGAEIQCVKNEYDLLTEWTNLICREDPDIIIGYNIFGFDYEFMFRRSLENNCAEKFLALSRYTKNGLNGICGKTDSTGLVLEDGIENKQLVIASGEYDLKFYDIPGRLQIDMYAYFRRDFNLSSYKLDDVAGEYISDTIKHTESIHIDDNPYTELYSGNLTGLHKNDYIHLELVTFTVDYYDDGKKFKVIDIYSKEKDGKNYNVILIEGHHVFEKNKKLKWGVAKDDVTPQDIFRLTNGDASDRAIVAKYCIQDCNLVHHLMKKIDVITGYVEMSNICSVPISFLVFRGQGIKLTSYVAKKCREKNTLMPDLEKKENDGGYEGAIVLPPKCKMYMDNPVACVDYSSLYPSSMISQNYSHDSKVWTKEYNLEGTMIHETGEKDSKGNYIYDNLEGYQYINTEFDIFEYRRKSEKSRAEKTKVGRKICRWAQLPNNKKSIMPSILEELLKARKDTRKKAKLEKDPFMQNILDKRQLGYKVTANSLYGQCGARTSTFYEKDVAASTTATGRQMIMYARGMVEDIYGNKVVTLKDGSQVRTRAEYIYGDTDSVFYTFNLEDLDGTKITGQRALEITIEVSFEVEKVCSMFLKPPMYLEYEKTFMPFILLSKKRYVGMLYEDDPNKGYLKYMGLSLKRRDNCDYLKDTYGEIINILMKTQDVQQAIDYLNQSMNKLIDGNVSMDKLSITKSLRSDYKNPQQIGHWVLSDRIGKRDPGNKPKPGDRIKYVFVTNPNKKALTGDKIETPEFITQNNLTIDYVYYITNQLMKPLQQLFGLAIEDIWKNQNKHNAIVRHQNEMDKLDKTYKDDIETLMKAREKECSKKIKVLLFDKKIREIDNKVNKQKELTFDMFSAPASTPTTKPSKKIYKK